MTQDPISKWESRGRSPCVNLGTERHPSTHWVAQMPIGHSGHIETWDTTLWSKNYKKY